MTRKNLVEVTYKLMRSTEREKVLISIDEAWADVKGFIFKMFAT